MKTQEQVWKTVVEVIEKVIKEQLSGQSKDDWLTVKAELKKNLWVAKDSSEFFYKLNNRTDISQDEKWTMQEQESWVELAYILKEAMS